MNRIRKRYCKFQFGFEFKLIGVGVMKIGETTIQKFKCINRRAMHTFALAIGLIVFSLPESAYAQSAEIDFKLAAGFYSRSQWSESGDAFEDLIRRYPGTHESASARFFLAEVKMQNRDFTAAIRHFQRFRNEFPDHTHATRAIFRIGESAFQLRKFDVALRFLEEFYALEPDHELTEFALPYLGEIRIQREEPQLAQLAFESALKRYPQSSLANRSRLGLAKSLQHQGFETEATRFYQFLITQDDDKIAGEAHLQLGMIQLENKTLEAAEQHFRTARNRIPHDPKKSEAIYWLARTQVQREHFKKALASFHSIKGDSLDARLATAILFDGAICAIEADDEATALVWLERLRVDHSSHPLAVKARQIEINLLQKTGDSERSLALIREIQKSNNQDALGSSILESEGRRQYENGHFRDSIDMFAILLRNNLTEPGISTNAIGNWRYMKGIGHLSIGEFEKAEREFNAIQINSVPEALQSRIQLAQGTARYGLNAFESAIEPFEAYLESSTENESIGLVQTELMICFVEAGRWTEADELLDTFPGTVPISKSASEAASFLAVRADRAHRSDIAKKWYRFLASPGNDTDDIKRGLTGLGWMCVKASGNPKTLRIFERLIEEFPDNESGIRASFAFAQGLEKNSDYQSASLIYETVSQHCSAPRWNGEAMLRMARILQRAGGKKSNQKAKFLMLEYLRLPQPQPKSDEAIYQLGWINRELGLDSESIDRFSQIVNEYAESVLWPDAAYRIATDAVENKDFDLALNRLDQILERSNLPSKIRSHSLFLKGQVAASTQQWDIVSDTMRKLIAVCQDDRLETKSRYWLAESLFRKSEFAESRTIFQGLAPEIDHLDSKLEPWIQLRIAQCFARTNAWSEAGKAAIDGQRRFPNFESAYEFDFVHGRSLEDAGRMTEARVAYERIISSSTGQSSETAANAQWRIGETYFHQEEFKKAIQAYYKVDSLYSYHQWRSAALLQAAKCQERLQRNPHAIQLYTQLIKNYPNSQHAPSARERLERLQQSDSKSQRVGKQPSTSDRR